MSTNASGACRPHKKAVAADEFGMGFCCWAMEEIFDCETWADTSTLIKIGAVFPIGSKRPDFVCGFKDGSLGIFEAKGTTGTAGNLTGPMNTGKTQTQGIGAQDPIKYRVVVGCALGGEKAKVILVDPIPKPQSPKPSNLTADLVKKASRKMRRAIPLNETEFRGPRPTGARRGPEVALKREEYREDKRHGWLSLGENI